MVRRSILVLSVLVAILGCSRSSEVSGITADPVDASDLSGQTFNVLAKTEDESVILLGHLSFDTITDTEVSGTWDFGQWSGPAVVPSLPTSGSFTGSLENSTLLLEMPLPDGETSLGIVSQGFVGERLSGTLSLLPSLGFQSTFEAIRAEP